jgi:hypothetical protein
MKGHALCVLFSSTDALCSHAPPDARQQERARQSLKQACHLHKNHPLFKASQASHLSPNDLKDMLDADELKAVAALSGKADHPTQTSKGKALPQPSLRQLRRSDGSAAAEPCSPRSIPAATSRSHRASLTDSLSSPRICTSFTSNRTLLPNQSCLGTAEPASLSLDSPRDPNPSISSHTFPQQSLGSPGRPAFHLGRLPGSFSVRTSGTNSSPQMCSPHLQGQAPSSSSAFEGAESPRAIEGSPSKPERRRFHITNLASEPPSPSGRSELTLQSLVAGSPRGAFPVLTPRDRGLPKSESSKRKQTSLADYSPRSVLLANRVLESNTLCPMVGRYLPSCVSSNNLCASMKSRGLYIVHD